MVFRIDIGYHVALTYKIIKIPLFALCFFGRGSQSLMVSRVTDSINSLLTSNTNSMVFRILNYGKPKFTD